jgi:hypothetical protein
MASASGAPGGGDHRTGEGQQAAHLRHLDGQRTLGGLDAPGRLGLRQPRASSTRWWRARPTKAVPSSSIARRKTSWAYRRAS